MLRFKTRLKQRGVFTLVTTLLLTLIMSISMLTVAKVSTAEQRISANMADAKQAFAAAQAGLDFGTRYLAANRTTIVKDANSDGYIDTYSDSNINNATLTNGAKYTITYTNPVANNLDLVRVQVVGASANNNVTKTLNQLVQHSATAYVGAQAVTAKNIVALSGNINITNTVANKTIESGGVILSAGNISLTTSYGTTGNVNNLPISGAVMNNAALASATPEAMFQNFFGANMATVQAKADITNPGGPSDISAALNNVKGKVIWINGDANIAMASLIGTPTEPVIIIVNGNLNLSGAATVNGFIYATGNMNMSGTIQLNGSFATAGNFNGSGNVNVNYDTTVINSINSRWASYGVVAGSWRDF